VHASISQAQLEALENTMDDDDGGTTDEGSDDGELSLAQMEALATLDAAATGISHARSGHFHGALFVLNGESVMEYTGPHENDLTAHG
jgi:hypothetical protein